MGLTLGFIEPFADEIAQHKQANKDEIRGARGSYAGNIAHSSLFSFGVEIASYCRSVMHCVRNRSLFFKLLFIEFMRNKDGSERTCGDVLAEMFIK